MTLIIIRKLRNISIVTKKMVFGSVIDIRMLLYISHMEVIAMMTVIIGMNLQILDVVL